MGSRNCFQTLNYEFSTVQQQRRESALGRYIVVILELKIRTSGNFSNGENGQLCFCTLFVAQTQQLPTVFWKSIKVFKATIQWNLCLQMFCTRLCCERITTILLPTVNGAAKSLSLIHI